MIKINSINPKNNHLVVNWNDGTNDSFHYVWLRDHLQCSDFFDSNTKERLVDAHTYLTNTQPNEINIKNGNLNILWPGEKMQSEYSAQWLHSNSYSKKCLNSKKESFLESIDWQFNSFEEVARFDYQKIFKDNNVAYQLLNHFCNNGFSFIENAPQKPGVVKEITNWLGYLREVSFGDVRDIKNEAGSLNVAFTSREAKPHIDGTNYIHPYVVQFLHCIQNQAEGGNSNIVDGFAMANNLKKINQSAFDTLTKVKVKYKIGAGEHDMSHSAPVIELDREGKLYLIRFSNQQRRELSIPFEDIENFYFSYNLFSKMVNDPTNQLKFRFQPGNILMFNNLRILHAREAFNLNSGLRHLQLASTDIEMVYSRLRRLSNNKIP